MSYHWFYDPRSLKQLWLTRRFNTHREIMWEYVCPTCGAYVGVNQSLCPCGHELKEEKEKLRAPPRWGRISFNPGVLPHDVPYLVELDKFLRTPRGSRILDEFIGVYALQKVLKLKHGRGKERRRLIRIIKANKQTLINAAHAEMRATRDPKRRKWLAKNFTPIFSDGFELNSFDLWTGTNGSPTIASNVAHHGIYSVEVDADQEYFWNQITTTDTIYVRRYIRWTTNPAASGKYQLGWAGTGILGTSGFEFFIYNDAGTIKWGVHDNTSTKYFSTPNPTTDTWYCTEVKWVRNTASGITIYIDGASIGTNDNTTANIGITYSTTGTYSGMPGSGKTYYDCITIADSGPIGVDDAIFEEEFVSGDWGNWNGTTEDSGCVAEIIQTDPRSGTNHARFHVTATAADYAYVSKNLSYTMAVHLRMYLKYMIALPASGKYSRPLLIRNSGSGVIVEVRVYNDAGTVKWRLGVLEGAGINYSTYGSGPSLETWYCVEAFAQVDGSNGWGELRVDGSSILSDTGNDTDGRGNINLIRLGICNSDGPTEHDVLIDSVVVQEFGPVGVDDFIAVIGHETGDLSEYTSTSNGTGDTIEASTEKSLLGSYGLKAYSNGGGSDYAQAVCDISGQSQLNARNYFYLTSLPPADNNYIEIFTFLGTYWHIRLRVDNDSGTIKWQAVYRDAAGYPTAYGSSSPIANQWHCVEMYCVVDGSAGIVQIWVDGTSEINETGLNNNDAGDIDNIRVGIRWTGQEYTIYCDYLTISTSQIGVGYTFIDGFEDGDDTFPRWTSEAGTVEIDNTVSHSGDYCAKCSATNTYVQKNIAGAARLHVRFYAMFENTPQSNGNDVRISQARGSSVMIWRLTVLQTGGSKYLRMVVSGETPIDWAYDIAPEAWYCYEVKFVKHATLGEWRVWVNGAEEITQTGQDTSGHNDITEIRVGTLFLDYTETLWIDDVIIHSEYIGTEHLFEAYLETNDLSEFTGSTGSPSVVGGGHHGVYELQCSANGMYCYKSIAPTRVVFSRQYTKFSADCGETPGHYVTVRLNRGSSGSGVGWIGRRNNGGVKSWFMRCLEAGSLPWYHSASPAFSATTWYCLELLTRIDASDGQHIFYVDGSAIITRTSQDTDNYGPITRLDVGTPGIVGAAPTVSIDCIIASRRYIGEEVEEAPAATIIPVAMRTYRNRRVD